MIRHQTLPVPVDDRWRTILDYTRVPNGEGLYVVGSFARRVTVYSQQVRAISLIDALCGMGRLSRATRVAVVGGGVAGSTAAAALVKVGASVTVFEKEGTLMPLQRNSGQRFLHPHIYDWPLKSFDEVDAGLPIMNWSAGRASEVVRVLRAQWDLINGQASAPAEVLPLEVKRLERAHNSWAIVTDGREVEQFDIVITCVGFGVEAQKAFSYGYWADLPLSDPDVHRQSWLVSGAGDGALTDLMRLCIKNFVHDDALRVVVRTIQERSGDFVSLLKERVNRGVTGPALFDGLPTMEIAGAFELRDIPVKLNTTHDELFGTGAKPALSSVLNRLVARVLIDAGSVEFVSGRVTDVGGQRPAYRVRFTDNDQPLPFEDVLLRHGPEAPFGRPKLRKPPRWMEGLGLAIERMGREWDSLYEKDVPDPTLNVEHWDTDQMFDDNRLAPNFKMFSGVVVYSTHTIGKERTAFTNATNAALTHRQVVLALAEATGESLQNPRVASLCLEDSLNGPRAVGRTIRTLCEAPIAIFDATLDPPTLMFLLGMRAVLRQGVTLVVRRGMMDAATWNHLPFNLRDVGVVSVTERSSVKFELTLRRAVVEGLKLLARHPAQYSDLPGFTAIRNLGGDKEDYSPRTGAEQVLALCPFDADYERDCWSELQRAVSEGWPSSADFGPAHRVIDLQSPELLVRRLFDAIRRDIECVVDLTLNRANVFFELGARMVGNRYGARVIRCLDLADSNGSTWAATALQALDDLLGTRTYHVEPNKHPRVGESLQAGMAWPGGTLTPGYWFAMAASGIEPRQEIGGRTVEAVLWRAVEDAIGSDRARSGGSPVLYSDQNAGIQVQLRMFAFETLLAYVLVTDKLNRIDNVKRAIALNEMRSLLNEMSVDDAQRIGFSALIEALSRDA